MTEKRILIPFREAMRDKDVNVWMEDTYDAFVEDFTRPLDSDDVRGMIRGWDEWTEKERNDYSSLLSAYEVEAEDAVMSAIEIALLPAPEPDPWEEMDRIIIDGGTDMEMLNAWDRLKATRKEGE